jgi:phosphoglycolate phosphatase-like HAD superfamily hydrolase
LTRVVLFDLDGTVLTFEGAPPGPGRTALERAMIELHGVDRATEGIRVAGGTDRALARAMLARARIPDEEPAIARVLVAYVAHLEVVLQSRRYRPIGDVGGAVEALRRQGAVVGAATGNLRAGARLKLGSAGLTAVFDLALGAYGDDAEPRADIVRLAAERCRAPGHPTLRWGSGSRPTHLVVVGDTRHDVEAGRAAGARVVGVATDEESRAELAAAGADAIVSTCGEELVQAVMG